MVEGGAARHDVGPADGTQQRPDRRARGGVELHRQAHPLRDAPWRIGRCGRATGCDTLTSSQGSAAALGADIAADGERAPREVVGRPVPLRPGLALPNGAQIGGRPAQARRLAEVPHLRRPRLAEGRAVAQRRHRPDRAAAAHHDEAARPGSRSGDSPHDRAQGLRGRRGLARGVPPAGEADGGPVAAGAALVRGRRRRGDPGVVRRQAYNVR